MLDPPGGVRTGHRAALLVEPRRGYGLDGREAALPGTCVLKKPA